jgi:hypothetical protein
MKDHNPKPKISTGKNEPTLQKPIKILAISDTHFNH